MPGIAGTEMMARFDDTTTMATAATMAAMAGVGKVREGREGQTTVAGKVAAASSSGNCLGNVLGIACVRPAQSGSQQPAAEKSLTDDIGTYGSHARVGLAPFFRGGGLDPEVEWNVKVLARIPDVCVDVALNL